MSQSGALFVNAPVGAGVLTITGNNGLPVSPTELGDVEIIGAGDITVTGDPETNTLTITSAAVATGFTADDTLIAHPAAGNLNIFGGANITTSVPAANTIQIALTNNVNITGLLNVAGKVDVGGAIVAMGNITGKDLTANDSLVVNGVSVTHDINNNGVLISTGPTQLSALGIGVVQASAVGILSSTYGTNGQLLIGSGAAPVWSNITSPDGTIVVTNGAGTISLSSGAAVATTFNGKAGTAVPAFGALTITGDANINTVGAGRTITTSLANNITLGGSLTTGTTITSGGIITANAGLTVTAGNANINAGGLTVGGISQLVGAVTSGGTFTSNSLGSGFVANSAAGMNAFSTTNGNVATANGNIISTYGTTAGSHLVATTDLTLPATVLPGVLMNASSGLVSSTTGTQDGQLLIADSVLGPVWNKLTAGTGIAITYGGPSTGNITITNTGVGGSKAAFFAQPSANITKATGDGYIYLFTGTTCTSVFDVLGNFNLSTSTFTALTTGVYQFNFIVGIALGDLNTPYLITQFIYTPFSQFFNKNMITQGNAGGTSAIISAEFTLNLYLNLGDIITFGIQATSSKTHLSRNCDIFAAKTYIQGIQIS